ncbi:protein MON2 homolog [Bolinopsis microptera]|uniref:protein MON2 homolog n=1 Tax=Bolinopsis microptera TaxID=2820187 RepID=UPI00307A4D42
MAEIAFVMRAISSLIGSLQARRDHMTHIDVEVWDHVVGLYPYLIDCVTCNSNEVRDTLKEALHRFRDLLVPPKLAADETETDGVDNNDLEHVSNEPAKSDPACSEGTQTVEV